MGKRIGYLWQSKTIKGEINACPFRYQGQYEDVETGLYYNRFRYYSPDEGIYISQDPIRLASRQTNFYTYVNDCNTYIDPFGLNTDKCGKVLELKFKDGWSEAQKAAAQKKVNALNNAGSLVVTKPPKRGNKSASKIWEEAGKTKPAGHDIDHIVDLQLGGKDELSNMWPLDESVNRSLGKQIDHLLKDLPNGTKILGFIIS